MALHALLVPALVKFHLVLLLLLAASHVCMVAGLPSQGVDKLYDETGERIVELQQAFKEYLNEQKEELGCKSLKYYHSQKDRYQIEVPESVLKRHQPDHYELTSRRKGVRRFWTPELREMLEELKKVRCVGVAVPCFRFGVAHVGVYRQLSRRRKHRRGW